MSAASPVTSTVRVPLGRTGRKVALVVHVLVSVGWFGIAALVLFLLVTAETTTDAVLATGLFRAVETSVWLSVPLGGVAALTGVVLGLGTKWGVARYWWVVLKEVAFVPLVVTDLLVVAPAAHAAASGGTGRLLDPAVAHCVVLALATVVSLVKPFGRLPRTARPTVAGVITVARATAHRPAWLPPRRDLAIAVGVAVIEVGASVAAGTHQDPRRGIDALAVALLLTGALSLAWRTPAPVTVFGVVFVTTLTYAVIGYPQGPVYLALIIAFCTVLLTGHRAIAWAGISAGWLLFLWLPPLLGTGDTPGLAAMLGLGAWLLVLATTTEIVRIRRERAADARHAREEEARLRASEERLRIARELHDVVAHNLSLINVQAGTALHLIHDRPEHAEGALAAIKQASKEALDELRSLVDVLRDGGESAPRLPTPTLADVEALVERTTAAGVPVEMHVDGARRPLPMPVETAAYRVAQEALTNVVRHAGTAHTVVHLTYLPDALVLQIDDDGLGAGTGRAIAPGKGITGMRERVHALGGELEVGAPGPRGFRVRARIPIGGGQ